MDGVVSDSFDVFLPIQRFFLHQAAFLLCFFPKEDIELSRYVVLDKTTG